MPSGDCKLKVQLNACIDKYIDVFHDLSIKLRPQLTKNAQGYGHRLEMVKVSPACVGHNKNLSPLQNILLLLFVEKAGQVGWLARALERRRRLKYDYMPHIFMTCATSVKQFGSR